MARRFAAWAASLPAIVIAAAVAGPFGCGKKGPPLPPLRERPAPVARFGVRQVGDRILISFDRPTRRTTDLPLDPGAVLEITLTPESYGAAIPEGETVWSLESARWDGYSKEGRMEVPLRLSSLARAIGEPAEPSGAPRRPIGLMVQVVEPKNRRGEPVTIRPLPVCAAPGAPAAGGAVVEEGGVRLSFGAASPGEGGDASAVSKVNIYRFLEGERIPEVPAAVLAFPAEGRLEWLDDTAPYALPLRYVARVQTRPGCESADSARLSVERRDTFPPAPPEGLVAVAESSGIRLFWRPGHEADLGGYRVWRGTGTVPAMDLLTPDEIVTTSYTDTTVVPGVTYTYAVTARDRAEPPNESAPSARATETAERRP